MPKELSCRLANLSLMLYWLKDWLMFRLGCRFPGWCQKRTLRRIICRNRDTAFGQLHRFEAIRSPSEFRAAVPISSYDDLSDWLSAIKAGQPNILTADEVLLLEPTGGSSRAEKLIPYTEELKREFLRGVRPWLFELLLRHKQVRGGSAYWSISPWLKRKDCRDVKIAVGFQSDGEYFSRIEQWLIVKVLSVNGEVGSITDIERFRYATLMALLGDRRLSLISIWSPTFLLILLDKLEEWRTRIADELEGNMSERSDLPMERQRAAEVVRVLRRTGPVDYRQLWPRIAVISCWGDGHSSAYLSRLAKVFPEAEIQPKGLMATEGIISLPVGREGAALAVRSHFLEFREERENCDWAETLTLEQLSVGRTYSVLITTGGGLYRYRLGDLIRVIGWRGKCPLVRFVGRSGNISDLFGEKLDENFVGEAVSESLGQLAVKPRFAMLAPESGSAGRVAYVLFLEPEPGKTLVWSELAGLLDRKLAQNYHYANCRAIGQLDPVRIFLVARDGDREYLEACCDAGQKMGDVKPTVLSKNLDWSRHFTGEFVT